MSRSIKNFLASTSIAAILIVALGITAFAQTAAFPDVPADHENATAIQFMKDNTVFTGYPDGTFQPNRVLNRAEQLKVYMLLHGINPDKDVYKNCFPDVKTDWYAPYVCFAKAEGWVVGYQDGTFKPAQEVNKVEALKMLAEIQGWAATTPLEAPFTDTPLTEWYIKYVDFAKSAGLLTETGTIFSPANGLIRAGTAELLFRSLAVYALNDIYTTAKDSEILALNLANLPLNDALTKEKGPSAEYGDAPESGLAGYAGSYANIQARFPSYYDTNNSLYGPGAHALQSNMEYLGDPSKLEGFSYENDVDDPADNDGKMNLNNNDGYDDGVRGLNISLISMPPPATLTVDVTVASDAPDMQRYLNVLIDLNMDGRWRGAAAGGEPEWVVKNFPINVAPGSTETITTDAFAYSNGWLLTPTSWMRTVLSREPINADKFLSEGWDGSGEFAFGEVEDYFLQLPKWATANGGTAGGLGGPENNGRGLIWGKPAPIMFCPPRVLFPKDVNAVSFRCQISNLGGEGDAKYDLWKVNGGVDVNPTTGVVNVATAPPGFPPFGVVGNPVFVRFWATRGTTPSQWGYTVEGVDPTSTVEGGNINLGLVPGDKDEGYEADDAFTFTEMETWASGLDDAYLFEDGQVGPVITDLILYELDDAVISGEYHYKLVADVRNQNASATNSYTWTPTASCGTITKDGAEMDWTFTDVEAIDCMTTGITLSVSDGTNSDTVAFTEIFAEDMIPVNGVPIVEGGSQILTSASTADPVIYELAVYASDPEGQNLTYNWTGITCGTFVGSTTSQAVVWQYAQANKTACSLAEFTVEVSDPQGGKIIYSKTVF